MTVEPKILKIKDIQATIYDFPKKDDILPMHSHNEESTHITIVSRGKFLVKYNNKEEIANPGDIYDWNAGDPHEFISLKSNSRIVNVLKTYARK